MLTIQPNFISSYSKNPAFGRFAEDAEYCPYEEVAESPAISYDDIDDFNLEYEKENTKNELALWEQTKSNLDSIAKTTESVPALRTGTKVLSGLISVAIGWGGLRWGTVGTLEVLSKINKSQLIQGARGYLRQGKEAVSGVYKDAKKYVKARNWYKNAEAKVADMKQSALDTSVGRKYTEIKEAVKGNSIYNALVKAKKDTLEYFHSLNPKRVFVETMGVAGGGTAAVNTITAGKAIDGNRNTVERDKDGQYIVNGKRVSDGGYYRNVA